MRSIKRLIRSSKPGGVEELRAFTQIGAKWVSRYAGEQSLTVLKVVFSLWSPGWGIS
jgi:hypothetical protein